MDKRQWSRVDQKISVKIMPAGSKGAGNPSYLDEVWTKDVGVNGFGLVTGTEYAVGSKINLEFQLPNKKETVKASARVAWSKLIASSPNQYRIGVAFETIQSVDRAALLDFVHDDGKKHPMIRKATGGG